MCEEQITRLDIWFEKCGGYFTNATDGEYSVHSSDMDEFVTFLRLNYPDMIGIPCLVGNEGIWFKREDLERTRFY